MDLTKASYQIFGKRAKSISPYFKEIEENLNKADLPYTLREYLSLMLLTLFLSAVISFFASFSLIILLTRSLIETAIFSSIITAGTLGGVFGLFYLYPEQAKEAKKKRVEHGIYFTTTYMATMAGTGIPPYKMFEIIGQFEEFGEVARISRKITRDVNLFGLNTVEAIEKAASNSPSQKLRELFWGMKTTITAGGDLRKYLEEKGKGFIKDYKREIDDFTKVLSIFMEVYTTLIIVGSIFALVLTSIMGLLGKFTSTIRIVQYGIILIGLPLMTAFFMVIMKGISPREV